MRNLRGGRKSEGGKRTRVDGRLGGKGERYEEQDKSVLTYKILQKGRTQGNEGRNERSF